MQKSQEWQARIVENEVQAPPSQLKASVSGLITLDRDYHLESIVQMLRSMQLAISGCTIGMPMDESGRQAILNYLQLLHDLATEFDWQARYGVRLYSPL